MNMNTSKQTLLSASHLIFISLFTEASTFTEYHVDPRPTFAESLVVQYGSRRNRKIDFGMWLLDGIVDHKWSENYIYAEVLIPKKQHIHGKNCEGREIPPKEREIGWSTSNRARVKNTIKSTA